MSDEKDPYPRYIYDMLWGIGEWTHEPDFLELEHKGFKCEVRRSVSGALCGYLIIEKGHPWYGKEYDQIGAQVHGGLTYSEVSENALHYIGFDCAHSDDITPSCEKMQENAKETIKERYPDLFKRTDIRLFTPTYKNIHYVTEECKKLADQALEALNESRI